MRPAELEFAAWACSYHVCCTQYALISPFYTRFRTADEWDDEFNRGEELRAAGAVALVNAGLGEVLDLFSSADTAQSLPLPLPAPVAELTTASNDTAAARVGVCERKTKETSIRARVCIDGSGDSSISTGIGFLDHMFSALAKHGKFDIELQCEV